MKQHSFYDTQSTVELPKKVINKLKKVIPVKAIRDYEDLFLGRRSGHLTEYIYNGDVDYYTKLVQEEKGYYLTRTETEILVKNSDEIARILGKNCNIVEIGPGPEYILKKKVLPLLNSLQNISSYTALDIKWEYAMKASKFISQHLKNVLCDAYEANCMIRLQRYYEGKTCLLFLGSTLSNFTDAEINKIFSNFADILKKNDYILFTMDCNTDLSSIKKAYDNFYMEQITSSVMHYFKKTFMVENFDPTRFQYLYEWNSKYHAACANLISMDKQNFYFNNNKIVLSNAKKYRVIISRKFKQKFIDNILYNNNLKLTRKFVDDENKMVICLAQKY